MREFMVGDRVRMKSTTIFQDADWEGLVGTIITVPDDLNTSLYIRVKFEELKASPYGVPFCANEIEMAGEEDAPVPCNHIYPAGAMWIVNAETVPTRVEYFGTDKDDRALYREVRDEI